MNSCTFPYRSAPLGHPDSMSPELQPRRVRYLLLGILLLFVALAVGYGQLNPIFEAPDEQHHFFTARYIAQNGRLPSVSDAAGVARQEAAQPPLYYLLAALLIAPLDTTAAEAQLWPNPTVRIGEPQPTNVNAFVHTAQEAWPWQGYALAVHLLRLLAVLIGVGTLMCIYGSGRLLWPGQPAIALLATALVAFLPQFAFLHGAVTNDVLIIFLCSAALWQMLRLWLEGTTAVRLLLLGVTIGLAVLTKMAGLLLLPLAALLLVMLAWQGWRSGQGAAQSAQHFATSLTLVLGPALLLSGWLLWRNWMLYGDVTAVNQFVALAGGPRPFTLRQVWADLDRVALSSVAFFGWMNVLPPRWLHAIWLGFALLAGGGLLLDAVRWLRGGEQVTPAMRQRLLAVVWLAFWVLLVSAAWLRFMLHTAADQGRLLFPALLPFALFLAWGVAQWRQPALFWGVAGLALFTSTYALFVTLPGAYRQASLLAQGQLPPTATSLDIAMGQGLSLVAVEPPEDEVRPGDWAWVTLYWRAEQNPTTPPLERLGLYGRANAHVGTQKNYHGGGTFPATEWPPGQVIRERLGAQVDADLAAPVALRFLLRIADDQEPLEIARVKAVPASWPEPSGEPLANFDGQLTLLQAEFEPKEAAPGTAVEADLRWVVHQAPGRDLQMFLHLGDPAQPPLVQSDAPPLGGDYPARYWAAGEVIEDHLVLPLPAELAPGTYPLQVGLYDPQDGRRLPVTMDGRRQPHDVFPLGDLIVR